MIKFTYEMSSSFYFQCHFDYVYLFINIFHSTFDYIKQNVFIYRSLRTMLLQWSWFSTSIMVSRFYKWQLYAVFVLVIGIGISVVKYIFFYFVWFIYFFIFFLVLCNDSTISDDGSEFGRAVNVPSQLPNGGSSVVAPAEKSTLYLGTFQILAMPFSSDRMPNFNSKPSIAQPSKTD